MDQQSIPASSFGSALKTQKVWMNYHLQRGDIHMVHKIANKISDADIAARIKRLHRNPNHPLSFQDEIESFRNISNLKKEFSKRYGDTYLIYKMCCEPLQGEPSYIFKTSKTSLQIAAKMAGKLQSKGCETHLKFEPAFFDGMHRHVQNYKSLTLWAFHPGMQSMQHLAVMECPKENSYYVEKFFSLFNQALSEYLGEEGYKWDPAALMMDETGCNFDAVDKVFGDEFHINKTLTCQFHFKQCAEKKIQIMKEDEQKTFRKWLSNICTASTVSKYHMICNNIEKKVEQYKMEGWWHWWKVRRFNIVPALCEVGHSSMKRHWPM